MEKYIGGSTAERIVRKLTYQGATDVNVIESKDLNYKLGKFFIASLMINGSRKRIVYGEDGKKIASISDGKIEFNKVNLTNEEKDQLLDVVENQFGLTNLGSIAQLSGKPRFQLKDERDGSTLFDKLQLRDSEMSQKLPDGLTISSLFEGGFLTYIDTKDLPQGAVIKNKEASIIPVIATSDGKVFEVPSSILEYQGNDPQSLKYEREKNTLKKDENGNVVQFPENVSRITEKARYRIRDNNNRNRDDEQYLTFRTSTDYLHGTSDSKGYNTELYYERIPKNLSEEALKKGTQKPGIYSEEIPPYDRAEEISDKANEYREDLRSDDDAIGEFKEYQTKTMNQIIDGAIRNWGLDKVSERDAIEINRIMQAEIKEQIENIDNKNEIRDTINSEITKTANERAKYLDIAYKISKDSDIYGIKDVYDKIMEIKSKNTEIDDITLYKQIHEQCNSERVLGDNTQRIS